MARRRLRRDAEAGSCARFVVGLALFSSGLAFLAGACARFTPNLPMRSRSGDLEIEVRSLRAGPRRELVVASRSTQRHQIRQAWLTVPTREPCSGGAEVGEVRVDGAGEAGALSAGEHEVAFRFADSLNGYALDIVLDMLVDDGVCVRAPAVSQVIGMTAADRVVVTAGMGALGNSDLDGLAAIFDVRAGAGLWWGSVLTTIELGAGQSYCNFATCGRTDDGGRRASLAWSATLESRLALASGTLNRLGSSGLVGARYSYSSVQLPTTAGDHRFDVHAIQGVLVWGFGDLNSGPFRRIERALPFEVAVPIGVLIEPGARGQRVGFAAGMELRFVFHI